MEQRDVIKDAIDKAGKVLASLVNQLLNRPDFEQATLEVATTNKRLKIKLDLDVSKILSLNNDLLLEYLCNRKLDDRSMETLGDYFTQMSKTEPLKESRKDHLIKSIELYDLADKSSKVSTLERMRKKDTVLRLLKSI